jgi:hypothetical protein
LIKRCFGNVTEEVILKQYESLVRPKLEYAVQAWRLHLQKDIMLLEKVHGRATQLIVSLRDKPYDERMKKIEVNNLRNKTD